MSRTFDGAVIAASIAIVAVMAGLCVMAGFFMGYAAAQPQAGLRSAGTYTTTTVDHSGRLHTPATVNNYGITEGRVIRPIDSIGSGGTDERESSINEVGSGGDVEIAAKIATIGSGQLYVYPYDAAAESRGVWNPLAAAESRALCESGGSTRYEEQEYGPPNAPSGRRRVCNVYEGEKFVGLVVSYR